MKAKCIEVLHQKFDEKVQFTEVLHQKLHEKVPFTVRTIEDCDANLLLTADSSSAFSNLQSQAASGPHQNPHGRQQISSGF